MVRAFALNVDLTQRIAAAEKEDMEGLTKASFNLEFGEDGSGIFGKCINSVGGVTMLVSAVPSSPWRRR